MKQQAHYLGQPLMHSGMMSAMKPAGGRSNRKPRLNGGVILMTVDVFDIVNTEEVRDNAGHASGGPGSDLLSRVLLTQYHRR